MNFEDSLYYGGEYGEFIVEYDKKGAEVRFTGLAYDLFANGNIDGYLHVKEGIKDGQKVDFYPNGNVKQINYMGNNRSEGMLTSHYETGEKASVENRKHGVLMTFVKYDKQGQIIEQKLAPTEQDLQLAKIFE